MRFRGIRSLVLLVVSAVWVAPAAHAAGDAFPLPRGYTIAGVDRLADGLTHVRYVAASPRRNLNVAYVRRDAAVRMRTVVSNERIAGGLETVRSMCGRVRCLMGVNGDLFSFGSAQPAGGLASGGAFVRTPPPSRAHVTQDAAGSVAIENVRTTIRFFVRYPDRVEPFYIHGINVARATGQAVLYTPQWAPTTQTGSGFEIVMTPVEPSATPKLGGTMSVLMTSGFAAGSSAIPEGAMVLSAHGWYADLLSKMWKDVLGGGASPTAEISFASDPAVETFTGGWPVLLRDRRPAFPDQRWSFYGPQARTMLGRTSGGDVIVAVIDGGKGSYWEGVRLLDGMRLMSTLGAVDAINLDGGGSSTFVAHGRVLNHPLRERGVATALAFVAAEPG